MAIEILYEDKSLIVCVKPAGVLSEEGGLPDMLQAQLGEKRIFCVHRLDQDAGGVMVYAKNGKMAAQLSEAISSHQAKKEYLLIAEGAPEDAGGTFTDLLFHDKFKNKTYIVDRVRKGVKEAKLDYRVLSQKEVDGKAVCLLSVRLYTGRSHQIRVQFASRKMPLAGDGKYGSRIKQTHIALWSYRYSFIHPDTKKPVTHQKTPPICDIWTAFKEDIPVSDE